jgi:hypothetical protein
MQVYLGKAAQEDEGEAQGDCDEAEACAEREDRVVLRLQEHLVSCHVTSTLARPVLLNILERLSSFDKVKT